MEFWEINTIQYNTSPIVHDSQSSLNSSRTEHH